jgi:mannose-1-phosphate guanylyltransferase
MNPTNPMNDHLYAIIMAGGSGERFWPLSTPEYPKQFLRLGDEKSLLRRTVDRIAPLIPIGRQFVVAGEQHAARITEELHDLPQANLICEPIGRNTAACIGLASLFLARRDPEAVAVVLPADHHIVEAPAFLAAIKKAAELARGEDGMVVIGIRPGRPETGYGYIRSGPEIESDVYAVLGFHEKPDEETARRYLAAGDYFWNTGIFVWQNRTIERLLKAFLPEHWSKLQEIHSAVGTAAYGEILARVYPTIQKISVDYGVVEKTKNIRMVWGRFAWDDLGSWTALDRILTRDQEDNVVIGQHIGLNTANCIIYGRQGKVVATIGLRDLIIAETEHGLLICPKDRAQEIRKLLGSMSPTVREERTQNTNPDEIRPEGDSEER